MSCHICKEPYVNPVTLSCNCVFCYICIKDHVLHLMDITKDKDNSLCPKCDNLFSLPITEPKVKNDEIVGMIHWAYSGNNCWWAFANEDSKSLERMYQTHIAPPVVPINDITFQQAQQPLQPLQQAVPTEHHLREQDEANSILRVSKHLRFKIDFNSMIQKNITDETKTRHIKRIVTNGDPVQSLKARGVVGRAGLLFT